MRPKTLRLTALTLLAVILLGTVSACGGRDEPTASPAAPATELPAPTATAVPPTPTPVPATPTPVPTDTPAAAATPEDQPADASALPDMPLPDDAEDVSYELDELSFTSPSDVETLIGFFRDALSAEGWLELSDFSLVDEALAFAEFERDDESISLTIISSGGASETAIDLSSAPSLTGATDTGSPGMTVADWPTPPDAADVSISGDTLSFKTGLSLVEVAEFYRPTYESLDLNTSCLDDVADYTSVSCSFSNGDITISFFAFEGFEDTEVEIELVDYTSEPSPSTGELGVTEEDGLPLPDDHTGYSAEGGEFRRTVSLSSPSDLATLVGFFQAELASRGWTLDDSEETDSDATLRFSGADGELVVTLAAGAETEVLLVQRNRAAAEEAGVLPPAGQARLYLVNFTEEDMTVTIDGQTIAVAPGAGMESPDDAPTIDLAPGTYEITTEVGGSSVTDEIVVGPDETWGLLLDEQGALPLQMF